MVETLLLPRSTCFPVDVNAQDLSGNSPLHLAVQLKNVTITEILLAHGADNSLLNSDLKKAVQIAKEQKSNTILDLLLKGGREQLL